MSKEKSTPKKTVLERKRSQSLKVREIDSLRSELESERQKAKDYLNRLMYLQADLENYRKRVNKNLEEITKYGSKQLIDKLLPVLDDLEHAIKTGSNGKRDKGVLEGVEMILKKFYVALESEGLSEIDAVGKPFDPNRHEVVENVTTEKFKEGTVVEVIRKGYMLNTRVIRPSLVKVAVKNE